MRAQRLFEFLCSAIPNKRRILIKGVPGGGKTDIVNQACKRLGADIVLMHPAISDPTDFKGLPAMVEGEAHFMPFGDLVRLVNASKLTVCFPDDIGQAPMAVQAGLMQLVLSGAINGTRISKHVTFIGATNDTTHMAGVSGMIEPLKSRWDTIVELDVHLDDWCQWALDNNMPSELIAFIRFRPELLSKFKPTKELTNSPCPRGWAAIGRWLEEGEQDIEVFGGAVGEGAATEFMGFLKMHNKLPSLEAILLNPEKTPVPEEPAGKYAVATGLARKATPGNCGSVLTYLNRMEVEFQVMAMKDATKLNKGVVMCKPFVAWAAKHSDIWTL